MLTDIPLRFDCIYAACDTYPEKSIKNSERVLRGEGEEFVIKTPEIRIPPNFTSFLSNGKNKERLFELVEEV